MYIRKARMEDLDQVTELEAVCFSPSEGADRERLRGRLEHYPDCFWLGFDDFRNLICFVAGPLTKESDLTDEMFEDPSFHDPDGSWRMIFTVCTAPQERNKGYASIARPQPWAKRGLS